MKKKLQQQLALKYAVAREALDYVPKNQALGVGTGSTVACFLEVLADASIRLKGAVASSKETADRLQKMGVPVVGLNDIDTLPVYIDGADAIDKQMCMIKGGGAALTGEKIIAQMAQQFICMADQRKYVPRLGQTVPVPIEVIPMARSAVARQLVALGGRPVYRQGVVTDYGNVILDVYGLALDDLSNWDRILNQLPGVVTHGLFLNDCAANILLLADGSGVRRITHVAS